MATSREIPELVQRLGQVPLFQGLPADDLSGIVGLAHSTQRAAGEFFFNEGEAAEEMFVLTDGRVKLTQVTPEDHQVVLRIISSGEAFGGVGAFGEMIYPVSAEVIEPSVALTWTSATMRRLFESHPAGAERAARRL
jgi:CRP/FNR family transcriptional regulator